MNRFLLFGRKFIWLMLYITPLILGGYYFGGKILKKVIISELNKTLNVDVLIGSFELNNLKDFPQIGMRATNVRINESFNYYGKPVLRASEIVAVFNPIDLIQGKHELHMLKISYGSCRIYEGKNGLNNYTIFKSDTSNQEASSISEFGIEKFLLKNFRFVYENSVNKQSLNVYAKTSELSGKFSEERFAMTAKGEILISNIILSKDRAFFNKNCLYDLNLSVNQKTKSIEIDHGDLAIDRLGFSCFGKANYNEQNPEINLQFEGRNVDIQSLISLSPEKYQATFQDYQSSGKISVSGSINGPLLNKTNPQIDIVFLLNDIAVFSPKNKIDIRNLQLSGSISNKEHNNPNEVELLVDLKNLKTANSQLSGFVNIPNLSKPSITTKIKGYIDFRDFSGAFGDLNLKEIKGSSSIDLSGALLWKNDKVGFDFSRSSISGDIRLENVVVQKGDNSFLLNNVNSTVKVDGNDLPNLILDGQILANDVHYKGEVNNWQSYLFGSDRLILSGSFKSSFLDLNKIIDGNTEETAENAESETPSSLDIGIDFRLKAEVDTFLWSTLRAQKLSGECIMKKGALVLNSMRFNAWEGVNMAQGYIIPISSGYELSMLVNGDNINITPLFEEMNNFGQTEITSENLSGRLNATIQVDVQFDRFFNVIEDKVLAHAQIKIVDGHLRNYKTLENLSSFVSLEDLKDVQFQTLENTIRIENSKIFIPSMSIINSAMNIDISGSQGFDLYMDYHMAVAIDAVLAGKSGWMKKKRENQFEDSENGGLKAYIHMYGTPDDLKIKYDKKSASKALKENVKKEKKSFFSDLKKELKGEQIPTKDKKKPRWEVD